MTAQGKMTAKAVAEAVAAGQAIRVLVEHEDPAWAARFNREPNIIPATRKTGVATVLITGVKTVLSRTGNRRAQRLYQFTTSLGVFTVYPVNTFILAPEDPAGIKRAHVEALELDQEWERMAHLMATPEAPMTEQTDGGVTEVTEQVTCRWDDSLAVAQSPEDGPVCDRHAYPVGHHNRLDLTVEVPVEDQLRADIRRALTVKYPPGTPEHVEYVRKLRDELAKFVAGEGEYARPDVAPTPAVQAHVVTTATVGARVVKGDVVTIHTGTRYFDVLRVEEDMARVSPVDPMSSQDPAWVAVDLLHVVPPVGCYATVPVVVSADVEVTTEVFALEGPGWHEDRPRLAYIKMIKVDPQRLPQPAFIRVGLQATPAAALRLGSSIVLGDRTFQVVWDGDETKEPTLAASSVRGRMIPRQA